jgi:lysozyme
MAPIMADINLRVVDIYHDDTVTSFQQAADSGLWGIIHKATTGATGTDPEYANRRAPALSAGLLWGAYHWGTNADVASQVENFLDTAQPDETTLVALDFEETAGNQMTLDQAREFLTSVAGALGRKPVLYCGGLFKTEMGNTADPFFGSHRLWLAQYGVNPVVQASWNTCWLWQYTDSVTGLAPNQVPGIPGDANGNLDCNSYGFSKEQLIEEWAS